MTVLRDILVPRSLVREPARFGGTPQGDCLRGDLVVAGGMARGLRAAPATAAPRMMLPLLTEAHCHLDKCHTLDRIGPVGGDLAAAITAQTEDKANWTADDLRRRMSRGLSELMAAGCNAVRSHIDWGDVPDPPYAWSVLQDLARDHAEMTIQAAALTGIDQLAEPAFCDAVAGHIAPTKGAVLGAFILHHKHVREGLNNVFAAADRAGLPLDFHVDEGLGAWNGLEMICDIALETGFQGPILCGHAVSLIDRSEADFERIADKLRRAGVSICALPTTNLYLQDRQTVTPDRRGLTRLRELHAAGVPVIVGSDNVADAFCPMGQHDPRAALHLAALAAHLDPPMGDWLPAITLNPATAMGLEASYIETTPVNNLLWSDVGNTADLVAGRTRLNTFHSAQEFSSP